MKQLNYKIYKNDNEYLFKVHIGRLRIAYAKLRPWLNDGFPWKHWFFICRSYYGSMGRHVNATILGFQIGFLYKKHKKEYIF